MQPLYKVFISESIQSELNEILYSGNLNSGKYVQLFENALKKYIWKQQSDSEKNHLTVVNTYNSAASIVWSLIGLKEGDEVIASPMSCLASNQPLALKGVSVKWTDIDPRVGSLNPDEVRKNITPKTRAILHYFWGGYPGYIDEINAIGNEYGIPVVQDAIESFGAEYKGNVLGNTGADFTLFSFQPVRLPTSIDGGGIVCKRKEDHDKVLLLRDYGIDRSKFRDPLGEISEKCDISLPAYGATMNELSAFVGYKNMEEFSSLIAKQRTNAESNRSFIKSINNASEIGLVNTNPNYWIFSFLVENRDAVLLEMRNREIYSSKVHIRNDYYSSFGSFDKSLKGTDEFSKMQLSIPSGWWLNSIK